MWRRFNELARNAVFYAQEEAGKFGESHVSTEHILLGLLREPESAAMRILAQLKVQPVVVRFEVERLASRGFDQFDGEMQLTPRGKKVVDLAGAEAKGLGHDYVGTAHLLLGVIHEGEGLGGRILEKLRVRLAEAREAAAALDEPHDIPAEPGTGNKYVPVFETPHRHRHSHGTRLAETPKDSYNELVHKAGQQIHRATRTAAEALGKVDQSIVDAAYAAVMRMQDAIERRAAVDDLQELLGELNRRMLATSKAYHEHSAGSRPGRREEHPPLIDDEVDWERLTNRARNAMVLAQKEAGKFGYETVEPEHLLLALLRDNGSICAKMLERVGVDAGDLTASIESRIPRAHSDNRAVERLSWRTMRVVNYGYAEARYLGNNFIGTEHLLLGLLRENPPTPTGHIDRGHGFTGYLLRRSGADLDRLRELLRSFHFAGAESPPHATPAHPVRRASDHNKQSTGRLTEAINAAYGLASEQGRAVVTHVHLAMIVFSLTSGKAARLIDRLGVDRESVRRLLRQAEQDLPSAPGTEIQLQLPKRRGRWKVRKTGSADKNENSLPPMSAEAQQIVRQAKAYWANLLGSDRVATEHLLLALFHDVRLSSLLVAAGVDPKAAVDGTRQMYEDEG